MNREADARVGDGGDRDGRMSVNRVCPVDVSSRDWQIRR